MRLLISLIICLIVLIPVYAQEKSSTEITGHWLTQKQDAIVEIFVRNDLFYGKIVWLDEPFEENGIPKKDNNNRDISKREDLIMGLEVLKDFRQKKKNKWSGGSIYDPDNGKTYSCKIKQNNETLNIRGYVGISLLGRTEIWTRATLPDSTLTEPIKE